jgi:wobble nucleotide-excising tRNase
VNQLCIDYNQEIQAKQITETQRDAARVRLDQYRTQIFPTYETAINKYLQRFNAGFRLQSISPVNTRGGSTCNYSVLIDQIAVPISSNNPGEPCFKNTLSAGDRNTLALAFFFSALEQLQDLQNKVIVIDDPITSLDEHRSLTTIQEIRRLLNDVNQIIVLSHSKSFLFNLWDGTDNTLRSALKVTRLSSGSTLESWDVNNDCITEHDKRHALVKQFISNGVGINLVDVAVALRPILEAFCRVAYPNEFPAGSLLGQFLRICQQREGSTEQIMLPQDRIELREILDYANLFHHDTNMAYQTAIINDHELNGFTLRTMAFATRPQ